MNESKCKTQSLQQTGHNTRFPACVTCDNTHYNHLINLLLFIKGSSKECIKAPKSKDTMPNVFNITLRIVSLVSNLWMNAHFWTCAYILTIMSTDKPILFPLLSLSDPRLPFVKQSAAGVLCACIIVFVWVCVLDRRQRVMCVTEVNRGGRVLTVGDRFQGSEVTIGVNRCLPKEQLSVHIKTHPPPHLTLIQLFLGSSSAVFSVCLCVNRKLIELCLPALVAAA